MENASLRRGIAAAAIGILCASAACAVPVDFAVKADAYLKSAYPADGPGAAVIVVDDGKVVYEGGQGLADIKSKRKIDPRTVFRLGSLTKQFTASVILQLEQEGKLSLSDPLSKFLPDYPGPGAGATIAQLLNHTAGIKNYTEIRNWMLSGHRAEPVTTAQLIDVFKNEPVDFAPGTRWHYSNSGYVLLGAIIEKITGKPWYDAVERRIAKPLGLKTIRYGVEEHSIPQMASGYSHEAGEVVPARPLHMSNPNAAGALVGSVEDFARWAEALHKGKVLGAANYARMITPTKLADGSSVPYGFAQGLGKLRGRDAISHGGETSGFDDAVTYIPSDDLFVAVFTNSNNPAVPPSIARAKIAAMALGEPYPEFTKAAVPRSQIEPLFGVYKDGDSQRRFFDKDGRLFTRRSGGADQEVFAAGGDRFFYGPAALAWFEVKRDPAGRHVMTMHQGPEPVTGVSTRVGPIPADAAVAIPRALLERYVGSYNAEGRVAKIALSESGSLTLQVGRQNPVALIPVSESEFRVGGMDAKVQFHSDSGSVTDFIFRQGDHQIHAVREAGS
jgi:D-alanyl-D-alanine carboxypeptidase